MKKILALLDKLFSVLSAIGFGLVSFCVLVQVIARYVPSISAPWTDETTRLFFLYTVAVACPMAIRYHEYASIDVLALALKGVWRHLLNVFVDAVIAVLCVSAIPYANIFFRAGRRSLSTSLQINLGIFYVIPLIIFILTAAYALIDIINEFVLMKGGEQ